MGIEYSNRQNHGETEFGVRTAEYVVWVEIKRRCNNSRCSSFKNYGGRGIAIFSEWEYDPSAFIDWIVRNLGRRPSPKHTLGRIDNNGNYEPGNLRWETRTQQNQNRRSTRLTFSKVREIQILYDKGLSQKELADRFGVHHTVISKVICGKIWKEEC